MPLIILLFLTITLFCNTTVNAAWKGPVKVVSATWGSKPGEIGSRVDDMGLWSTMGYCVTSAGYIVIGDNLNSRIQVFKPNGKLYAAFGPKKIPKANYRDGWPVNLDCFSDAILVQHGKFDQVYNLNGTLRYDWNNLIGGVQKIFPDDSFITMNLPTYYKYSSSGQLLKTYQSKPLELGEIIQQESQSDHSYITLIKFDDVTYKIRTPSQFHEYFRDSLGYLNIWLEIGEGRGRTAKYDIYGNLIAAIDSYATVVLNGDAYIESDKNNYSIRKWTWQPEPPRQPPPKILEVPKYFEVSRVTGAVDVEWLSKSEDASCELGHEIYRADTPDGPFERLARIDTNTVLYRDEATVTGKNYYYKVRAFCGEMYSEFTKTLSRRR